MIKKHSDDPDVRAAAAQALEIIDNTLSKLPSAARFDYGGHDLQVDEYGLCERCTKPIAEAQAAENTLRIEIDLTEDETVKEHLDCLLYTI